MKSRLMKLAFTLAACMAFNMTAWAVDGDTEATKVADDFIKKLESKDEAGVKSMMHPDRQKRAKKEIERWAGKISECSQKGTMKKKDMIGVLYECKKQGRKKPKKKAIALKKHEGKLVVYDVD